MPKGKLTEEWVLEQIKAGGTREEDNGGETLKTVFKQFDNGYVGYSQSSNDTHAIDMYVHNLPNGDAFCRSHEHTGIKEPEDFFQLVLNSFEPGGNYNEITRENANTISDVEYDKNGSIVRERTYTLQSDSLYKGGQMEKYGPDGDFIYGTKGNKEYLDVREYLMENKSLLAAYYKK